MASSSGIARHTFGSGLRERKQTTKSQEQRDASYRVKTMNLHVSVNKLDRVIGPPTAPIKPITILSVEDHPVFREGLRTILGSQPDMRLVAQASNAIEAIHEFRRLRPD